MGLCARPVRDVGLPRFPYGQGTSYVLIGVISAAACSCPHRFFFFLQADLRFLLFRNTESRLQRDAREVSQSLGPRSR